ncbi:MAG: molybdopterin-dependent oxidoreductase [Gemmatimonadota bacterium]
MQHRRRRVYDAERLNIGVEPEIDRAEIITSADDFFIRSHAPSPLIDPQTWRLEVRGLVDAEQTWTLEALEERFERAHVTATLVCAGLRRSEFLALGPLPGELPWGPDAAGTANWSGYRLRDVLMAAGVRPEAAHVHFTGLDRVVRRGRAFGFGGSIDVEKALADHVVLATHMNSEPLPSDHGFPLRAVVPGWIGARSVKWLGSIEVSEHPSLNYFQTEAYRIQRQVSQDNERDVTAGTAMTSVNLNAVIIDPAEKGEVASGTVLVRGWAIGSGGGPVSVVEIRTDDSPWVRSTIIGGGGGWTWTFWEAAVALTPGRHQLQVRAFDGSGGMPQTVGETWNVKGYGNNAWHSVSIVAR